MKEFHASCAWKQGYRFGFEIQPVRHFQESFLATYLDIFFDQVKSSRRDATVTVNFRGETGHMSAIVSCKDHDHSRRSIYDMCDTNEGGEVSNCHSGRLTYITQRNGR